MLATSPLCRLGLVALVGVGCVPPEDPTPEGPTPAPLCSDPASGFDRFVDEAGERGLGPDAMEPRDVSGVGLVIEDLDGDGDQDVLVGDGWRFPRIFANDGSGRFTRVDGPAEGFTRAALGAAAAVDLDGDGLPEVVRPQAGRVVVHDNLGGLQFGAARTVHDDPGPVVRWFTTLAVGDVDGDGDLDLALPATARFDLNGGPQMVGSTHVLLLNEAGAFGEPIVLASDGQDSMSLLAAFTDRDGDGDADLLITTDRPELGNARNAFWRNDGPTPDGPILVNDAAEVGVADFTSGMGIASVDLNGDGLLDYCIADGDWAGPCYLSGSTGYVESSLALGLDAAAIGTLWSTHLEDLDNDGRWDAVAVGGDPERINDGEAIVASEPNLIWQGTQAGFVERTAEVGFAGQRHHYTAATGDLDGDGWLELLVSDARGNVHAFWNRCSEAHWIELRLQGAAGNQQAIGAVVTVTAGDAVWTREVQALRTYGQSSTRVHLGLGERETVDEVHIAWPDGAESTVHELAADGIHEVAHPDAG